MDAANGITSWNRLSFGLLFLLIAANSFHTSSGLSISNDRGGKKLFGGYKITPKFCTNTKTSKADAKLNGPAICMFNHECVERKGEVIGACMDGFLFGTCCLLSGIVETSLANENSNLSQTLHNNVILEKLSTKEPTRIGSSTKKQVINNQYYGAGADDNNIYDTKFEVDNEAVAISSPVSYYGNQQHHSTDIALMVTQQFTPSQSFSTELPSYIQSTISSEESHDVSNSILFSDVPYDHSDISHSHADTELLITNKNTPQYSTSEILSTETRTEAAEKNKFSKPIFKLKPTHKTSTDKYVLVHTITNDDNKNDDTPAKKPSTNESIQSIILMLNGSNAGPGPEYIVSSMENSHGSYNNALSSPSPINPSTISHITTRVPHQPTTLNVPSTSYVFSPNPTRRKTTSKTTTTKLSNKVKITATRTPQRPTTLYVPSTSYVYSPNPVNRRTTTTTHAPFNTKTADTDKKETTNLIRKTTPKPSVTIQTSASDVESNYVVISGGGITKHPSPTVHITPKPLTNILTPSTMNHFNNKQTKRPSNEHSPTPSSYFISTERPPYKGSTPATFISTSIYVPAIQDFHNEGYFVVTHRPTGAVSSTAIYSIRPEHNADIASDIKKPIIAEYDTVNFNDEMTQPAMGNDELNNFPPVRNPNLNMTNNIQPTMDESDISTPSFVEDDQLNSKIDLLVSKLVASMQGNVDNLVDIVYERKNVSAATNDIHNMNKNGTIQEDATKTPKPTKTTVINKVTSPKPPTKVPTQISGRPSRPTKKPSTKVTTKKPQSSAATKKPTTRPISGSQTSSSKKPPSRITTTVATKKPTKKVSTTEKAPPQDEIVEEEDGSEDSENSEQPTEEEGTEETAEEEQPAVLETGKIQCGIRPHFKSGRIVGGKAAAFGEFPWQVLVRESTWLGLFTKNKCGGVLISNNYVLTAAHCQPGFLASLVTVFGEYDISADLETKRSISKNVKRVIVHRQYDAATFENDLAILELESPIKYDTHIIPICMPPDGAEFTGKVATVSGWGRLKYGGGVPSILQEVRVPIMENSMCQEMFQTAGHSKKILPSFLCAGYANGQKDSCEGDSGGPLVMPRADGRYELVGTVSHGIKCASPYLPGVYMRTNFYKPWIKSVTGIK